MDENPYQSPKSTPRHPTPSGLFAKIDKLFGFGFGLLDKRIFGYAFGTAILGLGAGPLFADVIQYGPLQLNTKTAICCCVSLIGSTLAHFSHGSLVKEAKKRLAEESQHSGST